MTRGGSKESVSFDCGGTVWDDFSIHSLTIPFRSEYVHIHPPNTQPESVIPMNSQYSSCINETNLTLLARYFRRSKNNFSQHQVHEGHHTKNEAEQLFDVPTMFPTRSLSH